LSCLLRKSICNFVSINSGLSFHPFKFYLPVLFVQGYCSLPDFFLLTTFFIQTEYNKRNAKGTGAIVFCRKRMYVTFFTISALLAWYQFYLHFVAIKRSLWTKNQYPRSNALHEEKKIAPLAKKSPSFYIMQVIFTVTRASQR
jgi:hypothetical protein